MQSATLLMYFPFCWSLFPFPIHIIHTNTPVSESLSGLKLIHLRATYLCFANRGLYLYKLKMTVALTEQQYMRYSLATT